MKTIQYDTSNIRKKTIDDQDVYDFNNHLEYITNIVNDISFCHRHYIESEIKCKLSSYKQQDKIKRKFNEELYISYDCLLNKIADSNLKCYYCKKRLRNKAFDRYRYKFCFACCGPVVIIVICFVIFLK